MTFFKTFRDFPSKLSKRCCDTEFHSESQKNRDFTVVLGFKGFLYTYNTTVLSFLSCDCLKQSKNEQVTDQLFVENM